MQENSSSLERPQFEQAVEQFAQSPMANLETYQYFAGEAAHRDKIRDEFLADATNLSNPPLDLSEAKISELKFHSTDLIDLLGIAEQAAGTDDLNQNAFYEVIAQRTAEVFFLLEAYRVQNTPRSAPDYERAVRRLHHLGSEIYGLPNPVDFWSALQYQRQTAEAVLTQASEPESQIINEYLDLLPRPPEQASEVYQPQAATVDHYAGIISSLYGEFVDAAVTDTDKEEYSPVEMVEVFQRGLERLGADDWRAAIKPGATAVDTNQLEKIVYVGAKRATATAETMRKLVAHEIGVHVLRRKLGEHLPNPLLWNTGLAGYYEREEGLGVMVEQALYNQVEAAGTMHYVNVGLSLGLDGTLRDFREIFEIEWRRRIVDQLVEGKPLNPELIEKQRGIAYGNVLRIRRGFPSDFKGVAFTKDLAYFNGTASIWRYLEANLLDQTGFMKLLYGKYDPIREDHRTIVEKALESSKHRQNSTDII